MKRFVSIALLCWACLSSIEVSSAESVAPSDPIAGRAHWAFRPLQSTAPREGTSWAWSTIDRYVADAWTAVSLEPVDEANPLVLLRRTHLLLTGLPPSADEVSEYLASPDRPAFRQRVEALLHSPQFGERWARHWLDLARYADSNGLDENFLFREAWRYRNWVVDAWNDGMPFDQFLLEQIAGDLLPFESVEQRDSQRIASGFMVVGPKVLLGINPNKQRMDVADELIDTIGKSVLGLTLGCARCHDHKFDPIPTEDYYALAGIMTSTQVMETRFMLGQQRLMERLVGLGPEGRALDEAYEKFYRELPKLKETRSRAESVAKLIEEEDHEGLAELLKKHDDVLAPSLRNNGHPEKGDLGLQQDYVKSLRYRIENPPKIPARAMIPTDREQIADEAVRRSGRFDSKGETVPRGFLQVITERGSQPLFSETMSGRKELAEWLCDTDSGAGFLTARVLANRIWYYLMGQGLVRTLDNFGRKGERPSHPALLDYLAARLIESDWSAKALIREIVLSRTFALSSASTEEGERIDPENRYWWRAHRRRLEPEVLRDAMYAAAGQLDLTPMQSSVWYLGDQATAVGANKNRRRTDFPARSLYLPMIRNDLPDLFEAFDFADPHATTGARPQTMSPFQGLYMLNEEKVIELAEATVSPILTTTSNNQERCELLMQKVFGRSPRESELHSVMEFLLHSPEAESESTNELRSWTQICQALFSSSQFQFMD